MTARKPDPDEDVELGSLVEAKTTKGRAAVVAVRMSPDLLARINDYGHAHGMTMSEVLRAGAEQLVRQTIQIGPNFVSGTLVYGPQLHTGFPSAGTGRSMSVPTSDEDARPR